MAEWSSIVQFVVQMFTIIIMFATGSIQYWQLLLLIVFFCLYFFNVGKLFDITHLYLGT